MKIIFIIGWFFAILGILALIRMAYEKWFSGGIE